MRYALVMGLIIASVGLPSWLGRDARTAGPDVWERVMVPEAVREAARQGRYWRATRLLDEHLAVMPDTTPGTILLGARLEAGWGHWAGVRELLEGRPWLDDMEAGEGWELLGRARIATGDAGAGADALARYLAHAEPADGVAGLAELRRGNALARADDPDAALDAFDRAAKHLPWFADWASYMAAEAAAEAGDLAEVNRRLAAADGVGGGYWRIRATAALVAGDTMAAREAALTGTRALSRTARSEAWAELGRLRLAAGDTVRGRDALVHA